MGGIPKFIKTKKHANVFCIISIAMIGLYPRESWNFVFEQGSLLDGTEIVSFARYGTGFYFYIMSTTRKNLRKYLQVPIQLLITIIFLKSQVFCYFDPISV